MKMVSQCLRATLIGLLFVTAGTSMAGVEMEVSTTNVVMHKDADGAWVSTSFSGEGTAISNDKSLAISLPQLDGNGNTLKITVNRLSYDDERYIYTGEGTVVVTIDGAVTHLDAYVSASVERNGYDFKGSMYAARDEQVIVQTAFRGYAISSTDDSLPDEPELGEWDGPSRSGTGPGDLNLPVSPLDWDAAPGKFQPVSPNQVAEVISIHDPQLVAKLKDGNRNGWLIVRGDEPFPLGQFDFAGLVKIECPVIKLTLEYNNIRGRKDQDDRLWLDSVEVIGAGDCTIFQNVDYLYADSCLFRNAGHVIMDTGTWDNFNGAVINCEFRDNYHDAFQYYQGAVINVAVTSQADDGTAHPDLLQSKYVSGLYWKHVYCGSPSKPIPMMGIRGYSITNSYFEDVRHYPSLVYSSIDILDASGTIFRNCYLPNMFKGTGGAIFD